MKYGRLEVMGIDPTGTPKHPKFYTQCDCGNEKSVRIDHLKSGRVVSCGCYRLEQVTTHGASSSRLYHQWAGMIARVTAPGATGFDRYGGRGIDIDPRWRESFEAFAADVGDMPTDKHQIDRIKDHIGYWPGNVRWATHQQNQWNKGKKRTTRSDASAFIGVKLVGKRWRAVIRTSGKTRHLGYFDTEQEAAAAYDAAARVARGEFARVNLGDSA